MGEDTQEHVETAQTSNGMDTSPSPNHQKAKELFKLHLNDPLEVGQTWYLMDHKWVESWKSFVSYDSDDKQCFDDDPLPPIDMSNLLTEKGDLKEHLMEQVDYDAVPEVVWECFVAQYGLKSGQEPLSRPVITVGSFTKEKIVEIYPLMLYLAHYRNPTDGQLTSCSAGMMTDELKEKMKAMYKVSESSETKLVSSFASSSYDDMTESTPLGEVVSQKQFVVIVEREGKSWPNINQYKNISGSNSMWTGVPSSSKNHSSASNGSLSAPDSLSAPGSTSGSRSSSRYSKNGFSSSTKPGLCGLSNLGNTCFMNSAIQCLSNVPDLTEFFLDGLWKDDLNPDNPLGMQGKIAQTYAELIDTMWRGDTPYTNPQRFKRAVGSFAPRFSGYQQHDSQELMAFLLDGLHEDLNRVKKKPYVEIKAADGRPDEEVAKEAWQGYMRRNDSIIIDLFHGLLKSKLTCPTSGCGNVSITFDPFCYLSLPLPRKKERSITVTFVSDFGKQPPTRYEVKVARYGRMEQITAELSKKVKVPAERLQIAKIYDGKLRLYGDSASMPSSDSDSLFVYELHPSEDNVTVGVYMKFSSSRKATIEYNRVPLVLSLPREATHDKLYEILLQTCSRFINLSKETKFTTSHNSDLDSDDSDDPDEPMDTSQGLASGPRKLFVISKVTESREPVYADMDTEPTVVLGEKNFLTMSFNMDEVEEIISLAEARRVDETSINLTAREMKTELDLNDCLDLFTTEERLSKMDTWYCPKCKEHVQALKKFDLWTLPKYLVVQLKRFQYNYSWRDKLDTKINYPVSDLDLSSWVISGQAGCHYELLSVSNHFGGLGGGHYTAFAKNHLSNKWYNFDDSSVSGASADSVVTKSGYVLIYRRKD